MSNKDALLPKMIELCKKADINISAKTITDTKPLLDACARTRCTLAKNLGKRIVSMADKRNVIPFDTVGMQDLTDEIFKRIRTIDGIIGLLQKVAKREKRTVTDIRRYLSYSSGPDTNEMSDSDDVIIEGYGEN
jgi:hypothetical protein